MNTAENHTNQTEVLMTRAEAMALLHVKSVAFWRYTREKRFPYYRVGKKMMFKRSEILQAIRVQ